jgi:hypothetical protein
MAEISDRNHRAVPQTSGLVFHWAFTYDLLLRVLWRGSERIYREKVVQLAGIGTGESCWMLVAEPGLSLSPPNAESALRERSSGLMHQPR